MPNNVIVHTLSSALHKFRPTTDEHIILHTMWEGATLPKGWASIINTCKALMLPSEGLRELFVNSGVTVPIGCFPYPVDLSNFTYQKPVFEDTFTFFT